MVRGFVKNYLEPASVYVAGTLGVGFLSLPYIASKTGLLLMLGYFVLMAGLMVIISRIFARISLATPDFKRFPGFVRHHLGVSAGAFTLATFLFVQLGVMVAYIIVGSQFLSTALQPLFGGVLFLYALAYFIIAAGISFFDGRALARVQMSILGALAVALIALVVVGVGQIRLSNLLAFPDVGVREVALPYGALLFSLWGIGFIPTVEEMVRKRKDGLIGLLAWCTIGIASAYALFTVFVLGVTGVETSTTALTGLVGFLDARIVAIALLAAAIVTMNAFVAQVTLFRQILHFDLGLRKSHAFMIAIVTPMTLFMLGVNAFIPLVSFIGGVFLSLFGLLILLMYKKIGGTMGIILPLSLVFILGILYQITYFFF